MSAVGVTTDEALRHCRAVTRRRARNFYYGLKLSPEPQRSALYAIYAWMRRADDLVDDAGDVGDVDAARRTLESFGRTTEAILSGDAEPSEPSAPPSAQPSVAPPSVAPLSAFRGRRLCTA